MTAKKHTVRQLTKAEAVLIAKRAHRKPTGAVIYNGPSMLDGAPIVVIAIEGSTNRKTGNMVQTYIIRSDMSPIEAVNNGADASVCGNCRHRGTHEQGRTCYVNLGQGALSVWRAYLAGNYKNLAGKYHAIRQLGERRMVRLGTYGDPAAVPSIVFNWLVDGSTAHTGYTHQWRIFPHLARYCMASTDTIRETQEALAKGWRTFRVQTKAYQREAVKGLLEVTCPASAEAGKLITCSQCKACSGNSRGRRGNITIAPHGGFAVMAAVRKQEHAR